jgi:L-threonylcarbamoyladenylate synthase
MNITRINSQQPQPELIARAAEVARHGAVIVFPTDTVYGVGVVAGAGCTPQALFEIKGRDSDKAIPWLVADASVLERYGEGVPEFARKLACEHWPGALTLIVRASASVPAAFTAQDGSIALRAPAHPIARALLAALGSPLAATSANRQGDAPATSLESLDSRLASAAALVIDGGPTPGPVPSTVVSCLEDTPRILREGILPSALLLH